MAGTRLAVPRRASPPRGSVARRSWGEAPTDDGAAGDLEVRRVEPHLLDAHAEHGAIGGEAASSTTDARDVDAGGRAGRARKIASLARVVQRLLGAGRGRGVVEFQLLVVRGRGEPRGGRLGDARYVRHASRWVWAPPARSTRRDRRFSHSTTREIRTASTCTDARDGTAGALVALRALDRRAGSDGREAGRRLARVRSEVPRAGSKMRC